MNRGTFSLHMIVEAVRRDRGAIVNPHCVADALSRRGLTSAHRTLEGRRGVVPFTPLTMSLSKIVITIAPLFPARIVVRGPPTDQVVFPTTRAARHGSGSEACALSAWKKAG
jgi:hypothetical protein